MKKCVKCGQIKKLSEFYVNQEMADGHLNKCIECTKKDAIEYRNNNLEKVREHDRKRSKLPNRKIDIIKAQKKYTKKHPKRNMQCTKVWRAIKKGVIQKSEHCEICGVSGNLNGHHTNYHYPLKVIWVCPICHKQLHKTQKIIG